MKRECETCIKRKTLYCPPAIDCMATDNMPYYQNRIMLLEENQSSKEQVDYLRRSIERKEETIIELEHERVPYTNEYVEELQKELNEENLQCSKYAIEIQDLREEKQEWVNLLNSFKNQQKEFIEYLENEIKRLEEIDESKISQCSITTIRCMKSDYKEILSRYKETIGYNE